MQGTWMMERVSAAGSLVEVRVARLDNAYVL